MVNYYEESVEIYKYRRSMGQVQAKNIYDYILNLFQICLDIDHKNLMISERFIIIKIRKRKYIEQFSIREINHAEDMFRKLSLN